MTVVASDTPDFEATILKDIYQHPRTLMPDIMKVIMLGSEQSHMQGHDDMMIQLIVLIGPAYIHSSMTANGTPRIVVNEQWRKLRLTRD